jgi:hypothetical protein
MSKLEQLLQNIQTAPGSIEFNDVIQTIDDHYSYSATRFTNGSGDSMVTNEAGANEGSCKIFSFAKLHSLDEEQTLNCFGKYYREDVLKNPQGSDHGNIRNFMTSGWQGIKFDGEALKER